jgi:DNA-directed RNA polymerase subunit alpha
VSSLELAQKLIAAAKSVGYTDGLLENLANNPDIFRLALEVQKRLKGLRFEKVLAQNWPNLNSYMMLEILGTNIDYCDLNVRCVNCLKDSNVRTLGDLVRMTEEQVLDIRNLGRKSFGKIANLLNAEGLNLGMRFEEDSHGVRVTDWGVPPSTDLPRTLPKHRH